MMIEKIKQFLPMVSMQKIAPFALACVGAILAVSSYLQVLGAPFVYDDNVYILHNTKLAELRFAELWRLFTEPYTALSEYLPLRDFSYWLDMALFGLTPMAFRIHSIVLYLLCLPLVYVATLGIWRYFRPGDAGSASWAAAAVTALFALHPSHVEAVVWIAARKDVLSGMFSLLALWLAVIAKREQGLSFAHATAALVALLAAMFSKATAVAVAPVIAMVWLMFWRDTALANRHRSLLLWSCASLLLAAGVTVAFAAIVTSKVPLYFGTEAVTRTLAVQGWLARLALSPESRHFFYPVFEDSFLPVMVFLGGVVVVAAAVGAMQILRKRSLEGFALLAFLLICLPSIQLIPYMPPSLVSDRFIFLAAWPAILLLVALVWRLKPVVRAALLLAIVLAWGFQTFERTRDWRSFEAMIEADLRAYPGYYMPAFQKIIWVQIPQGLYRDAAETASGISEPQIRNIMIGLLAADYVLHTETVATGNPQKAMKLLWKLWFTIKTEPVENQWNLPMRHVWKFCRNALVDQWEFLAKHFPDNALVHFNAGSYMLNIHPYESQAAAHLRTAIESQRLPESLRGTAYKRLGLALMRDGQAAEAESPLRAALLQFPPDTQASCLLSDIYKQTGRYEEAGRAEANCLVRAGNEDDMP